MMTWPLAKPKARRSRRADPRRGCETTLLPGALEMDHPAGPVEVQVAAPVEVSEPALLQQLPSTHGQLRAGHKLKGSGAARHLGEIAQPTLHVVSSQDRRQVMDLDRVPVDRFEPRLAHLNLQPRLAAREVPGECGGKDKADWPFRSGRFFDALRNSRAAAAGISLHRPENDGLAGGVRRIDGRHPRPCVSDFREVQGE